MCEFVNILRKYCVALCVTLGFCFNSNGYAQSNDTRIADPNNKANVFQDSLTNEEKSIEKIREHYESVLERDSTNYDALTNLGVIYLQDGAIEKSLYYFEKAVNFHPNRSRAYHNLGILNSMKGRIDLTIKYLRRAAELDSASPNSIRQLGIIYLQNKMFIQSIVTFNSALKRDKLDVESRLGKALAYWSLKNYDKVLAEINLIQKLRLRFPRLELLLAYVFFKKRDYENAMKYAAIDEEKNSSKAEGHYLLGLLYKMKGEKKEADYEFDEAFAITGQNENVTLEIDLQTFMTTVIK